MHINMSYPSISSYPFGLPDPFGITPNHVQVPLTQIEHISAGQILNSTSSLQLAGPQLLGPLVLNMTGASTGPFTLPTANQLQIAFGGKHQVNVGDVFAIPIFKMASDANSVVFLSNTGGTGTKTVGAWSSTSNTDNLVIEFTNTTFYPNNTVAYTLQ